MMFKDAATFSSFSVSNLGEAREFYVTTLGLELIDDSMGLLIKLGDGARVHIYEKPDHIPATFTVLNFDVEDIDAAVDELQQKNIEMEYYDSMPASQDEKGILRGLSAGMGPDIAWFEDPAGNILSVVQEK